MAFDHYQRISQMSVSCRDVLIAYALTTNIIRSWTDSRTAKQSYHNVYRPSI